MKREPMYGRSHAHRGIVISLAPYRAARSSRVHKRRSRFVTQTHSLGTQRPRPGALLIAIAIAVALYVVGRRLSR
jgi:hypothetical protein